jgi:8-oxo-dGTP diphosphatase
VIDDWESRLRFCPLCAAPLELRDSFGRPRKTCSACDYIQFRSPAAAAAVVAARGRDIVLVQRAIEPYRGQWGLPAGFQEYGETPEEAAIREAREETGLEVRIRRLLDLRYARDDPRKRVNVAIYLAEVVAGDMAAADDAADVRLFDLDALPEAIAFESNRHVLAALRRQCPHGEIR